MVSFSLQGASAVNLKTKWSRHGNSGAWRCREAIYLAQDLHLQQVQVLPYYSHQGDQLREWSLLHGASKHASYSVNRARRRAFPHHYLRLQTHSSSTRKSVSASMDDDGGGEDRLSALPDDVLIDILVKLEDATAAARTSVLAPRWRRLWALLPEINFEDIEHHRIGPALAAHEALDFRRLEVATGDASPGSVSAWLHAAARRLSGSLLLLVVRREEVGDRAGAAVDLPCFEKATSIALDLGFLALALPASGVFARLKHLYLVGIQLHGDGLGDAVSSPRCPSLQTPYVRSVRSLEVNFAIHSESLEHIELWGLHDLQQLTVVAPALERLKCIIASTMLRIHVSRSQTSRPLGSCCSTGWLPTIQALFN
ncbi:putative F-box/FBD/LRR-repeat protein At3g49030 [Brachypodium distachyon]|uniref:F-box/LRR-repeat protein 15/At3g58940/PEG3-like LRR domain-containing protein n=1 Tax=Brachypodium distachyon TaxID=15368 RepID=A0A2K2CG95_BRADI|nr:putative F-box/FBD/LRR-repeat protein At3g49030 [Brachypodium distachyon]PNT61046.1 hypothetical protein BRADI_5g09592v3 [Brachypodium distachyon]|eukprot:XP_010227129.2 putative F-box/FBD/LRR-repeat protein At3g49030 [Brachypodium distachyon]